MRTIDYFKNKANSWTKEFMELKNTKQISIKHRIDYRNKTFIFNCTIINRPTEWTRGILNRTDDGKYIFFVDYDYMKLSYIKGELEHLQKIYELGDIHIFKSSEKSFHAVSFAKLTAKLYIEILENSSCDLAFKNTPRFVSYRNWVLRNFRKGGQDRPQYIYTIKSNTKRQQSTAHYNYFNLLYSKNISKLQNPDGLTRVSFIDYPTGKNI